MSEKKVELLRIQMSVEDVNDEMAVEIAKELEKFMFASLVVSRVSDDGDSLFNIVTINKPGR